MSRTAWPTVASGDAWTASQHNTYGRDNDAAYWAFTTTGDMVYATSASTLARLAIGAAGAILSSTGSVPVWKAKNALSGAWGAWASVDFAPAQTFSSATWEDITGATLTLVLGATSTILVVATVTGNNVLSDTGRGFKVRSVVNGVADPSGDSNFNGSENPARRECLGYTYLVTNVSAGSRVVKMQSRLDNDQANYVQSGRLMAMALVQ